MEVRTVIIFRTFLWKVSRNGWWMKKSDFWNKFGYPRDVLQVDLKQKCPGQVYCSWKATKFQKRLRNPHLSQQKPQSHWGTSFLCQWVCIPQLPRPPAPPLTSVGVKAWEVLCWIPGFICINHFPMYQYKKYALWPKYSNLSAACQTTHLPEWSQARLLFGSNLSLLCYKTICL